MQRYSILGACQEVINRCSKEISKSVPVQFILPMESDFAILKKAKEVTLKNAIFRVFSQYEFGGRFPTSVSVLNCLINMFSN